ADPRIFFSQVSGTRATYFAEELDGQLRDTIIARMTDIFATCDISVLDMTANQTAIADKISAGMKPTFAALGLELEQFIVQNISLPEELQKPLDQRIS